VTAFTTFELISAFRSRGGTVVVTFSVTDTTYPTVARLAVCVLYRRHVATMGRLSCYFFGFKATAEIARGNFCSAYRPTGGSRVLESIQNVYGNAKDSCRLEEIREA
jgi:hypothetical protein